MGTPAQQWLRAQLVGYGAIELKKIYNRNLSRSFLAAVLATLASAFLYRLLWDVRETKPQRILRIVAYEEFVLPSSATAMGLTAAPLLPISEENAFDPSKNIPIPKPIGTQTRKLILPARDFSRSIGELPSLGAAERPDRVSDAPENSEKEKTGIVGGRNNNPINQTRGGTPVIGNPPAIPPSGGGRSGVGSATKPSPGSFSSPAGDPYGTTNAAGGGSGFSLEWLQGGTRKKISGELPKYPVGAKLEAELTFYATVDPDGTIKAILPAQKADMRLERSVIDALREWKFEALGSSFPQIEQTCLLRFIFQLE